MCFCPCLVDPLPSACFSLPSHFIATQVARLLSEGEAAISAEIADDSESQSQIIDAYGWSDADWLRYIRDEKAGEPSKPRRAHTDVDASESEAPGAAALPAIEPLATSDERTHAIVDGDSVTLKASDAGAAAADSSLTNPVLTFARRATLHRHPRPPLHPPSPRRVTRAMALPIPG